MFRNGQVQQIENWFIAHVRTKDIDDYTPAVVVTCSVLLKLARMGEPAPRSP